MTKEKKTLLINLLKEYKNDKILTEQKLATIYVDGDPWYIRMIDSTHIAMSNQDKDVKTSHSPSPAIYHVGQLRDEQYYQDLVNWLHNGKDINGKKYH